MPGESLSPGISISENHDVPIRFEIGEVIVELSPVEALAVAGRITATVECWMRSTNE